MVRLKKVTISTLSGGGYVVAINYQAADLAKEALTKPALEKLAIQTLEAALTQLRSGKTSRGSTRGFSYISREDELLTEEIV